MHIKFQIELQEKHFQIRLQTSKDKKNIQNETDQNKRKWDIYSKMINKQSDLSWLISLKINLNTEKRKFGTCLKLTWNLEKFYRRIAWLFMHFHISFSQRIQITKRILGRCMLVITIKSSKNIPQLRCNTKICNIIGELNSWNGIITGDNVKRQKKKKKIEYRYFTVMRTIMKWPRKQLYVRSGNIWKVTGVNFQRSR